MRVEAAAVPEVLELGPSLDRSLSDNTLVPAGIADRRGLSFGQRHFRSGTPWSRPVGATDPQGYAGSDSGHPG